MIHTGIYYEQAFSSTQFHFLVKLALAARLSKCKRFFFFSCVCAKRGPSGDHGNWGYILQHDLNIFKRCWAFPEQVSLQILLLESAVYFGTSEYFSGQKQKRISMSRSSANLEANFSRIKALDFCMSRSSAKLEANFSRIKALDFCVFNRAHSINSETNHRIRYKK